MYSKIEIFDTEHLEKYLLISNNNTLYIGSIVKDIVSLLKYEFTIKVIVKTINAKYNIQLSIQDVTEIKKNIDFFLIKKDASNLYKIAVIFNPTKISLPKSLLNILFTNYFYCLFIFFLITNCFAYVQITSQNKINDHNDNITIAIALFIILFFHELGHSFSAKKFNVNVKEIGLGLYYIFPVLYVNLKESWKLKKEKRIIINLSGIYFQLIIGSFLALFIFFFKENRVLVPIFKINLSILLLNLNPFLKFDGYWVISDLLEEINLLRTSNNLIKEKFKLKTRNKFNNWILLYTVLRIIFIVCIVSFTIKKLTNIYAKYVGHSEFNLGDNIFLLIFSLYIFKILIRQLKK